MCFPQDCVIGSRDFAYVQATPFAKPCFFSSHSRKDGVRDTTENLASEQQKKIEWAQHAPVPLAATEERREEKTKERRGERKEKGQRRKERTKDKGQGTKDKGQRTKDKGQRRDKHVKEEGERENTRWLEFLEL